MARRLIAVMLIVASMLVITGGLRVRAQEGLPVQPDPSECSTAGYTAQELLDRMGVTPVPAGSVPDLAGVMASPAAFALPAGTPADEATVAAVTAVVREVFACFNAGDFLAFLALTTENFLAQAQAEFPITEEAVAGMSASPVPIDPSLHSTLVALRHVVVLADGHVGALVDNIFPDERSGLQTDYIEFAQEDGAWKIDRLVEDLEGEYGPEAMGTPTAV